MTINKYPCSQQELYTIGTLGWNSCQQHLSTFTAFKAKYTAGFVTTHKTEIDAAKLLPDDMQRTAAAKAAHIQLAEKTTVILDFQQLLKRYIADAWPASQQQTYLDAAGQNYYAAASNLNWEAVEGMANSATTFMATYEAELDNGGMPAQFPIDYNNARMEFSLIHQTFLDKEETASIQGQAKVTANNLIYTALISMFLDGQQLFKNNEAVVNQFIFDHILYLVRGAGTAGIRGTVTNSITTAPVVGAIITVGPDDYTAASGIDGKYEISPAAAGTYVINVTAPGYEVFIIPAHVILTGTISTLNIELIPV